MATKKRNKLRQEIDTALVVELYLKGWSQERIGKKFRITQQAVSQRVKKVEKMWQERAIEEFGESKLKKIAELRLVKKEAWENWIKTNKQKKTEVEETSEETGGPSDGKKATKKSLKKETLTGNSDLLRIIKECTAEECKILGLYAPEQKEIKGALTLEELEELAE